jgi:hypothetical protein
MEQLQQALKDNLQSLNRSISERYIAATDRARAEYEYRSGLGIEMAKAKAGGMAATSLYEYCRSLEPIAKLREKRDLIQAKEDYATEMLYYYRAEIRIAEAQISAERLGK